MKIDAVSGDDTGTVEEPPVEDGKPQVAAKPSRFWEPSHMGLLAEWSNRRRTTFVASLRTVPSQASTMQATVNVQRTVHRAPHRTTRHLGEPLSRLRGNDAAKSAPSR